MLSALLAASLAAQPAPAMKPPDTRREAITETLFGTPVADPYRWLEDEKSPEVKSWMQAQDHFAREQLHSLPGREALMKRLRELYYVDAISVPVHRGGRYFYSRTFATKEKAVAYWREGKEGPEHVLLDPNTLSADGSISLGVWVPSWDGKKVAYALKANNSDEATLHVMDVATGQDSAVDTISGAKYAHPAWTPDSAGFYYTFLPSDPKVSVADRPGTAEIRFHRLGADPKGDELIHERTGDPATFAGVGLSRDGHWLLYYVSHGWNSTDVYFRDTRSRAQGWRALAVGRQALFSVDVHGDKFYVHTNEGAPRYRGFLVDPAKPEREAWKEIVPESKEDVLQGFDVVGGQLALSYMHAAASRLELRHLDGSAPREVSLPGIGACSGLVGNPDEDEAYYSFNSFTAPTRIFQASVKSAKSTLWAEVKLPIDPSPYTVEQVWYPSKDGTQVSMFLVHRKDLPRDGSTPFLLYGYGGFNVSMQPSFSSGLYPWLEAGGGYALANLRGGGEYGEAWHEAGKGAHKQNVFDDFAAAAQYLVQQGYTKPERLAIKGGSNGGLLVGAAMTQHPELYRAVVCQVPLLDMVRYHRFGSGRTWVPEYGSADDEAGFKVLHAYSPYHHVKAGTAYPSLLMLSADSDDRVDPMHARKFTAAVQACSTSGRPAIIRIEAHAGHGGADLVKQAVEQSADTWAFLMKELGPVPRR